MTLGTKYLGCWNNNKSRLLEEKERNQTEQKNPHPLEIYIASFGLEDG